MTQYTIDIITFGGLYNGYERQKIDCAKKLFSTLSTGLVTYDHVDSFQELMNKVMA